MELPMSSEFKQQKQSVEGDQTNVGRDVHTQDNNIRVERIKNSQVTISTPMKASLILSVIALFIVGTIVINYLNKGEQASTTVSGDNSVGITHTGQGDVIVHTGISSSEFRALSKELDVTEAALKSFFKILEQKQVPPKDLDSTLREIAKRYKELLVKVDTLKSNDKAVQSLVAKAKQVLESGDFDTAEDLFNQASDRAIEEAHRNLILAAESKAANGELKMTQLAYKEAGEYYEEATNLVPRGHEKQRAKYLNIAGENFYYAGLYNKAQVHFEETLVLREHLLDKDDPDVAESLNNLALLYQTQRNYDEAKPLYEQALMIWEKVYGNEHPQVATVLNNLAGLHKIQGKYEEAKPLYEWALAIDEKIYSQEHPNIARDLNNLAGLHRALGNYEKAKPLYEQALVIDEKVLGKEHPNIAIRLNNLAGLHKALGNYEEAKPLYQRAIAIFEKVLGKEHPNTQTVVENYQIMLEKMGGMEQDEQD